MQPPEQNWLALAGFHSSACKVQEVTLTLARLTLYVKLGCSMKDTLTAPTIGGLEKSGRNWILTGPVNVTFLQRK